MIGRRIAFNVSLFICSVFAICAGASPNWIVLGLFTSLAAFGSGGNLILDTTVFLEFLPGDKQWLLTLMACWWGLAPVVAAAFAWPFLSIPRYYCTDAATCTYDNNKVSPLARRHVSESIRCWPGRWPMDPGGDFDRELTSVHRAGDMSGTRTEHWSLC